MICVVDYGMGNLRSVSKALEKVGGEVRVSGREEDLKTAQKVVLPGVGAFGDACQELEARKLFHPLREILSQKQKPFLGICLGMQLLFEESEESPGVKGFGVFPGKVQKFRDKNVKIPHMGWNNVKIANQNNPALFCGVTDESFFYFVHSYYPVPKETDIAQGLCEYGSERFCAVAGKGSLWATQFHPEKSQEAGLQILKNFVSL